MVQNCMKPCRIPASKLYLKTLDLLRNRPKPLTLRKIAQDTGLPEGWLLSILSKPNLNPAVNRVEVLYEYLSGQTLAA